MEYLFFISEIQYDSTSSLTYPAALRGVAHKIGAEAKGKYISPSCVPQHGGVFLRSKI